MKNRCLKDVQGTWCCFCFKGLIHIAHVVCDLKEEPLEELDLLNNDFMSNGYPIGRILGDRNIVLATSLCKTEGEGVGRKESAF